jgi:hypothetical protein
MWRTGIRQAIGLQTTFEFGLKYEEIHLELFARLFAAIGPQPVEDWCRREPFGQYARSHGIPLRMAERGMSGKAKNLLWYILKFGKSGITPYPYLLYIHCFSSSGTEA